MLPIAPLMIEHRLIERMIDVVKRELLKLAKTENQKPNTTLLYQVIDFIRVYADQTHHGKEEDILFRELKKKEMSPEHEKIMEHLIEEHKYGRKTTKTLKNALDEYMKGDKSQLQVIKTNLQNLVEFYPQHIATEDKQFFKPVMNYFSPEEQAALLEESQIFDRKMIHRKYLDIVKEFESKYDIISQDSRDNWLKYM